MNPKILDACATIDAAMFPDRGDKTCDFDTRNEVERYVRRWQEAVNSSYMDLAPQLQRSPASPKMTEYAADLKAWLDARGLTIVSNCPKDVSCWLGLADEHAAALAGHTRCDAYHFRQRVEPR